MIQSIIARSDEQSAPREQGDGSFEETLAAHDQALPASVGVWLGAEPTFTDRFSEAPEWLSEALGQDKEERARVLLKGLLEASPGAIVLRPLGRQYAGEATPRWCYGLYQRRDGQAIWSGPPDKLVDGVPSAKYERELPRFRSALLDALAQVGWGAAPVLHSGQTRLVCCKQSSSPQCDASVDVRLARKTIHEGRVEGAGLVDELAREGSWLVLLHAGAGGAANDFWVELPAFEHVGDLMTFLGALGRVARTLGIESLGLRGFPPPVDDGVAWTTLTPDPAVLEVNQAPEPDMRSFHRANSLLFRLASEVGLSPYRLQYNGCVSDSGGGGQLTIGGPSPERSPFFSTPQLLPRLIRYVIHHPSLSYWFATQYVGGSSQSPRPDEGMRESFLELDVALEHLSRIDHPSPELLWTTLRHFLADASGNPHRSELNIEKLHNPYLPGRGQQGLVEFRALSMAKTLRLASARAMLFRSIVSMLSREDKVPNLTHWGDQLHDRFALPLFLAHDLGTVFADLRGANLALGYTVEQLLLDKEDAVLGVAEFEGCRLQLEEALEFWPLVGDVASQEEGGSRLVDASTSRIQVLLDGERPALNAVVVSVNGYVLPMQPAATADGERRVLGFRYRSFVPYHGMHPSLPAVRGVRVTLHHASGRALYVTLHPWRPDGQAYPGLPADLADAGKRRLERAVVRTAAAGAAEAPIDAPAHALTEFCLDLRRLDSALPG